MALTAVHGSKQVLKLNLTGSLTDYSEKIKDIKLPRDVTLHDITAMGATSKAKFAGLKDAKIPVTFYFETAFYSALIAKFGQTVPFEYGPDTSASGKPKASGNCIVQMVDDGGVADDMNLIACTLEVTGDITDGTFA